jgi:hypothetical protein
LLRIQDKMMNERWLVRASHPPAVSAESESHG